MNSLITSSMEVLHVMAPKEWANPIDVAEEWIHFVDDSVKSSELSAVNSISLQLLLTELRIISEVRC